MKISIDKDKEKHFIVGAALGLLAFPAGAVVALGLGVAAGIIKEFVDQYTDGTVDPADAAYTAFGAACGVLTCYLGSTLLSALLP